MIRESLTALLACVVTFGLCAIAYPALVYGVGHSLFPNQAEGSLIERDGKVIGSSLIAQPFTSARYFAPRPSAAGPNGYAADAASGSNLGTTNPALRDRIKGQTLRLLADATQAQTEARLPVDLVTTSGSGLDPEISPAAAYFQAGRVAKARQLTEEQVRGKIEARIDRSGALFGAPARVNVLLLNLDLDR